MVNRKIYEYIRACDTVSMFAGDSDLFVKLVRNKLEKIESEKDIKVSYYSKLQRFPFYFVYEKQKKENNIIYLRKHLTV